MKKNKSARLKSCCFRRNQEKNVNFINSKIKNNTDVQSIKIDLIHWLTELEDQTILRKVQELKEEHKEDYELTKEQKQELETRLGKSEAGETRFSSWDMVKQRVRNRVKDGL